MGLRLTTNTYAALPGGDLVLLDLTRGAYSCLPGCGDVLALQPGADGLTIADPELRDALGSMGAIEAGPSRPRFAASPPRRGLAGARLPAPGPRDVALLATALAQMGAGYWRKPFGAVIAEAQRGALGLCGDAAKLQHLALVFRRMLPWVPAQGVCLYRSFLLLTFLRLNGVSASWVFGVQTYAFEAHCWLQAGDLVLDDDAEHARGFMPVLALAP